MTASPVYNWHSKNILVVEDDESSAYLLNVILKETGANIAQTDSGNKAVEYVRQHPDTDLILMDIHLSEKDGFSATREIKSFARNVVVIAQTSYSLTLDQREAKQAGCDAYFTKPLNMNMLLDKMNTYLT